VHRLLDDDRSAAIAESVIGLAQRLSVHVTAEGVETPEHQRFL
jgi:EAL domain-containing protein (putative c-di-GMP-specific phosphodiesterase class I)